MEDFPARVMLVIMLIMIFWNAWEITQLKRKLEEKWEREKRKKG
jgi:hypothetical protein